MGLRALLFVYIFGGLTFLPLVLVLAWHLLPRATEACAEDEERDEKEDKDRSLVEKEAQDSRRDGGGDAGASASFAVLRRYDLQAALTALGSKTAGSNGNGDSNTDGAGGDSVSVYQTMYRSVFTGSKPNGSSTSLLQQEDAEAPGIRRKPAPASLLYIVLRHGHLMVYDSPAQVEVRHVISLANHSVSLQAGTIDETETDESKIPESDLFIKRTAIVLTPVELPNGALQPATAAPPKPFYLFSATNIEKEAFYHALLASRSHPPIPRPLDVEALIKLQSTLHSSSMTPEARALNALLGRMFLAIHRTDTLNNFVRTKIERKLARIQKPTFIPSLRIQSLNLGDAGPVFSNLKMRELNISGDTTISADMKYTGGLSITFLAVARLDLGPRFKARTVDLVLKTSIKRISGTMLLQIKPPPSNRMWFCFESIPEMEIRVEPVVSERKITYGFVLRAIEERVRTAIAEGLVRPNWDDIPFPFADTRGSHARGGMWRHEGESDHPRVATPARTEAERAEKTVSVPNFPSTVGTEAASTALSESSPTSSPGEAHIRRRTTDPAGHNPEFEASRPRPLRSPSISSPTPSVAIDGQSAERVRSDDASLRPTPSSNRKLWRTRGVANSQPRDALEELRDLRDRADRTSSSYRDGNLSESHDEENDAPGIQAEQEGGNAATLKPAQKENGNSAASRRPSDSSISTLDLAARTFSVQSAESERSTASSLSSTPSSQSQSKKANVLAATVAATNAARNWGWNTLQRNKNVFPRPAAKQESTESLADQPMGRGQPLPPPGVPLPGPQQKTLWGNMKRKPVPNLPARRQPGNHVRDDAHARESEEFEPWQENSGNAEAPATGFASTNETLLGHVATPIDNELKVPVSDHDRPDLARKLSWEGSKIPVKAGRTPPPLPRRPSPVLGSSSRSTTSSTSTRTGTKGGLHVPESVVDTVAAENATPDLAHGATDVPDTVDESNSVEWDIGPESGSNQARMDGDERRGSRVSSSSGLLTDVPTPTASHSTTGSIGKDAIEKDSPRALVEKVKEGSLPGDGQGDSLASLSPEADQDLIDLSTPQPASEEDIIAARVRARIKHHQS